MAASRLYSRGWGTSSGSFEHPGEGLRHSHSNAVTEKEAVPTVLQVPQRPDKRLIPEREASLKETLSSPQTHTPSLPHHQLKCLREGSGLKAGRAQHRWWGSPSLMLGGERRGSWSRLSGQAQVGMGAGKAGEGATLLLLSLLYFPN